MNKLFSKIATLSVGLAMAVGVGVAVGHKEHVYETKASEQNITLDAAGGGTYGNVTVATSIGAGQNAPIYGSSYGIRLYANNTLTVSATGYVITGISFSWTKNSNKSFAAVTASSGSYTHPSAAGTGTWSGSSTDPIVFTVGSSGQIQVKTMSVTYEVASGPTVSITDTPTSLNIGDTGTLHASTTGATESSVVITWSSSDPSVVSIDANTGEYEALAYGVVKFTASLTCTEGSASTQSVNVPVNSDLISIDEALEICNALENKETTLYFVTVQGYITSMNGDNQAEGKERALNISAEKSGETNLLLYGIYSDNALRQYAIVDGFINVTGHLQKYNTTLELKDLTINSYTDAAEAFAKSAYEGLNEACTTGPAAVSDEVWNDLAEQFGALTPNEKAKLANATTEYPRADVANWISRYSIIVGAGKANFMENVNVASIVNFDNSSSNSYIIIIVISAVSVLSFGLALALKKKRTK